MMEGWKKLAIRAAGFGGGFAVIAGSIICVIVWMSHKQEKPKPWNSTAITATYKALRTTGGEKNSLEFVYILQNNTDLDYRVTNESQVLLGYLDHDGNSLSFDKQDMLKIEPPLLVPAKSKVFIIVDLNVQTDMKANLRASDDVQYDWETKLSRFVDDTLPGVDGFVMMDSLNRYQVKFPNGWTIRGKESLRVKPAKPRHPRSYMPLLNEP